MKTVKIKLSDLHHDEEIVELRPINDVFVSRYRQAMRAGDQFPPLLIDAKTKAIISGNTRATAYRKEYGADHQVPVVLKQYKDRTEILMDAVEENAKHGNPLDGFQRKRFAARLIEAGTAPEKVATLFGVSVKRIEEWGGETVVVRGMGRVPTKRGLHHIFGQTISKAEYDQHVTEDRGVPAASQARQLARWIKQGWVNMSDPNTAEAMSELITAINDAAVNANN